jgi:quinol monooxygenase YgiN
MIIALGDVYAQIQRRREVVEVMRATQAEVSEQPGCVSYVFAETLEDPGHYVLVQEWRDQAALDAHYRSQAFARYQAQIGALLVRSSELRVFGVTAGARPVDSSPIAISQDD